MINFIYSLDSEPNQIKKGVEPLENLMKEAKEKNPVMKCLLKNYSILYKERNSFLKIIKANFKEKAEAAKKENLNKEKSRGRRILDDLVIGEPQNLV